MILLIISTSITCNKRFHQNLDYKKPMDVYYDSLQTNIEKAESEDQNAA